jgi:hypothetical protein
MPVKKTDNYKDYSRRSIKTPQDMAFLTHLDVSAEVRELGQVRQCKTFRIGPAAVILGFVLACFLEGAWYFAIRKAYGIWYYMHVARCT